MGSKKSLKFGGVKPRGAKGKEATPPPSLGVTFGGVRQRPPAPPAPTQLAPLEAVRRSLRRLTQEVEAVVHEILSGAPEQEPTGSPFPCCPGVEIRGVWKHSWSCRYWSEHPGQTPFD